MQGCLYFIPSRKVIPCNLERVPRFVPRIDFGVHYVRFGKGDGHELVDMGGKASETCFVSHEAMDVNEEQPTSPSVF